MTIKAHFDGKAIIPDEPVDLPVNQPLSVEVRAWSPVAPPEAEPTESREEIDRLFEEMEQLAVTTNHPVDDSRESIYSGTVDDPR